MQNWIGFAHAVSLLSARRCSVLHQDWWRLKDFNSMVIGEEQDWRHVVVWESATWERQRWHSERKQKPLARYLERSHIKSTNLCVQSAESWVAFVPHSSTVPRLILRSHYCLSAISVHVLLVSVWFSHSSQNLPVLALFHRMVQVQLNLTRPCG